jgi:hypothetical protein
MRVKECSSPTTVRATNCRLSAVTAACSSSSLLPPSLPHPFISPPSFSPFSSLPLSFPPFSFPLFTCLGCCVAWVICLAVCRCLCSGVLCWVVVCRVV